MASFLPFVLQNLNSLIQKEVGLLWGVDKEMKKLSSTLTTIQAVLEDAEQKQFQDKAIQNWLRKLNDAAYEVRDILDDCETEALRKRQSSSSLKKVISTSLLTCYPVENILFRHKIGNRMKDTIENLNAIADERKFHLRKVVVEKRVELAEGRETGSALTYNFLQLYGREEDKEKFVKILVENICDCQDVSVYPIIGMGGLGKTTLAQMVVNDKRVQDHFEPRIWVYVSQDLDVKRVIKAIIESVTGRTCKASTLDSLQKKLREKLNGTRYLLVLDDVWDEDQGNWDELKYLLACGSKGASIIVTTRVPNVASIMGTVPAHHLSFLSEEDCWLLFKQRAFGHGNEEHPNLVAIGKEIVKKCGGVPLAAKALGGLMYGKSEETYWHSVQKSEIWDLPLDKNSILPVLRLSYYNLPLELRRCFAYCANFLKGSEIEKEKLIHLWMANGFISSTGKSELEDIGNGIWNELDCRLFFQDVKKDPSGNTIFKIHDLMHDLARSVTEDECHMMEAESSKNILAQRIHHVTLVADYLRAAAFPKALYRVKSLHTILLQCRQKNTYSDRVFPFSCDFTNFGSLRVFDALGTNVGQLSSSIGKLKHLREVVVEKRVELAESRETSSALTQPQLYGRVEDKEKIVKMLVENICDCQDVSVYPIIGMGGLGKTTLAQMVFNDERVECHFEPKIWVYVSQDFDAKRVIKAIIESVSERTCEVSNLDSLQKKLREMLNGKRYLLVLDDVWDENQDKWDGLKYLLACGSKGASIIVTTRVAKVASIMGTVPAHHLSFLSEEDCWLLFKQRAFGDGNEERPNLVAIGKELVKKCGGVPLAAKALGGLLCFKSEETDWHSVQESEIWNLPQDKNSILPFLRLSYHNLPLELRRCFAYCAIFLKGSEIEKEKLIHLWMAKGFISSNGQSELEDIGNGIWNELYWRSFFQDVNKDRFGNIFFKIHDLMHDLAQSVMEDECHMEAESSQNISAQRIHHVTLVADNNRVGVFPEALYRVESLHTILLQYRDPNYTTDGIFPFSCDFTNFGSLRVFDALGTNMGQLSSSIGKLKHLGYLNLSRTPIRTLPKSICSLHNLQTLNLNCCDKLQRLPKNMKSLRSLRHLYLEGCDKIQDMPPKLGHLTLLRTLSLFVVGKSRGHRVVELQCLDLRGELCIRHLERVRNSMDAKEANLVGKQNLRILKLSWEDNSESELQANVEQLLESLEPHPNVEKLFIDNYRGAHFPFWMGDSILKNIVSIVLSGCRNCLELPAFGQLPSLRRLEISRMDYVEYIDNYFPGGSPVRGFPALEELHISELPNLVGLSREEGRELLPCLHKIKIDNCPKLTLPRLSSPKLLDVWSSSNVVLSSISNLNHLTTLCVRDGDMVSFPEEMLQNLTVLESLEIERCRKLKVLPTNLESLVSLKSLRIWWCHAIESLPDHGLRSLKSLQRLTIDHCNNLSYLSESLGHLTALEELYVFGCPKLVTLPDSIKHLVSLGHLGIGGSELKTLPKALKHVPALQSLFIHEYPELTSLPEWLGNLTSLQSLCISCCPKIPSLPHGFQRLTNLQTLVSYGCGPELVRRCQKEKGEDWYKIAHIPKIKLWE